MRMNDASTTKKLARLGLNYLQFGTVAVGRVTGWIDFPVPPNSSMRKTGTRSIRAYSVSGLKTYLPIAALAAREGIRLDETIKILDFGCGVGRQLLHFTRDYPKPAYYACDIDDTSVAFVARAYPAVQAQVTRFTPPLPYRSGEFDLVYSVSVFSHLNIEDQGSWLSELARITRTHGYCFLTTEGYTSLKATADLFGGDEETARARLDKSGFLYHEYEEWAESVRRQNTLRIASVFVGVEHSYGRIVLSPRFIRETWGQHSFEVVDVVEGIVDRRQDLVILRRR